MIVSHGIDSSMVHRRQCSFWESSRFDCSEAACRIRPFGVNSARSVPGRRHGAAVGRYIGRSCPIAPRQTLFGGGLRHKLASHGCCSRGNPVGR